ncbi:hypothetical protein VNO78_03170 [Psophocarpus tetragonolobus]|uniref:FAS1 domain-containing protein n=1 Tax=Psophocarpus tetragonolobus TaxID=3891 RepID=A0AAN9SZZ4_PSOTE
MWNPGNKKKTNPQFKNHTMQNPNLFFLFLILTSLLSPIASKPSSPPTQQLNNIIDALIGAGDFTTWVSILSGANATILPVSATLFVPRDASMDRPPPDPFLLPYHVVPQRLPFSELLLLPRLSRLPTLLAAKSISLTDTSAANFSLNHVPLTHPDLLSTPSLAVHAVKNFLDYSLSPDAAAPPPPFLPIGDPIGSDWNSAPARARFSFLFCFLLRSLGSRLNDVVLGRFSPQQHRFRPSSGARSLRYPSLIMRFVVIVRFYFFLQNEEETEGSRLNDFVLLLSSVSSFQR